MAMFRGQYDNDVTTWSPQGRLHQVEYAMEAVNQGSAVVGLHSATHAVLVALKRSQDSLSEHQKKIYQLDDHVGFAFAGLTADAPIIYHYLRNECLDFRYANNESMPAPHMVRDLCRRAQRRTQRYGGRPYGVGLLLAGADHAGVSLYQTCPSGIEYACKAMAIGARSQSARTYLERHIGELGGASLPDLVQHGLRALKDTLPAEAELTNRNVSIAIVGVDMGFSVYEGDRVDSYLAELKAETGGTPSTETSRERAKTPESMEVEAS